MLAGRHSTVPDDIETDSSHECDLVTAHRTGSLALTHSSFGARLTPAPREQALLAIPHRTHRGLRYPPLSKATTSALRLRLLPRPCTCVSSLSLSP